MFKLANGWTKAKVLAQVKKFNNGTRAMSNQVSSNTGKPYCAYQDRDNGNRCAIGCFIPNTAIGEISDKILGAWDIVRDNHLQDFMPFEGPNALEAFQKAHDDCDKMHDGNVYAAIEFFLNTGVE